MAPDNTAPLGSIENPIRFRDQNFKALLEGCLRSGVLFSDPTFPADQTSIGFPEDPDPKKAIKWKRPKEIKKDAVFVEGTTGTTDICQGQLGDCWLLAALSCLTQHPKLFDNVQPPNQSLNDPYAGIFHFRFWQYGEWVEVVVDDRLPVREGRLLFSYSNTNNEFWSALLEKAYAKLVGSYGSLKGGNISEGMEDFTGGIAYSLPVSAHTPPVMWKALTDALSRGSLLSCFIQASSAKDIGKVTGEGLIKGHAYAITDTDKSEVALVATLKHLLLDHIILHEMKFHTKVIKASDEILLLRLRNPWGFIEYKGPWSDTGKEWDSVDKSEKERIELKLKEDGEFWISANDFSSLYNVVELCSVNPESERNTTATTSTWTINEHRGSWVPGSSAGGSRKYTKTFWKNPQFQLVLTEKDHDDEENKVEEEEEEEVVEEEEDEEDAMILEEQKAEKKEKVKQCTVLVELLQKNRRQKDKINFLNVAFHVYKVPSEFKGSCLDSSFFQKYRPVGRSGKYKAQRGVWRKIHLNPGNYIIVGSTYQPNQPGEFFVRIFSKTGNTLGMNYFTCSSSFLTVMATPPVPEDQMKVQKTFDEKAGSDDRLNANQVMELFNSVLGKDYHLPLETCRQIIFAEDTEGRSTLSRAQAETLMSTLRSLQSIFSQFDEDSSGTMSPFELSLALEAVGMKCDNTVVQLLSERFAAGELQMPFYGFVSCVTRLRKLFALYETETSQEVKARGINSWLLQFLTV